MCGIFCLISIIGSADDLVYQFSVFKKSILKRGPDSMNIEISGSGNILLAASVLWLRGLEMCLQPIKNETGVLVYNGEVFGGFPKNMTTKTISDTEVLFQILNESSNIQQGLKDLKGPYSFIYYDKARDRIYFGRDHYGRRSLLLGVSKNKILLTSVALKNTEFDFIELPCLGVYSIDLITKEWELQPWNNNSSIKKIQEVETFLQKAITTPTIENNNTINFNFPSVQDQACIDEIKGLSSEQIFTHKIFTAYVETLKQLLETSIQKRVTTQPKFCQKCSASDNCCHSITGVLFSGGVDCAILALLLDKFIDRNRPIDLINVAFEKNGTYETPDRLTAAATLKELQSIAPERQWNFLQVDVSQGELIYCREQFISNLIYPLKTILDDSLGCALWIGSRASTPDYTSPCRTLLVGMGADELFGGYTRHKAALQNTGWQKLHEVLEQDWENLPHRNLARDDRVVSDHGRQLRTPYLDEDVVHFIKGLHCWEKTLPLKEIPQGIGEKVLLRSLAFHLGLNNAAILKKRALQFGCRIANSKEKGHEVSERL